MFIEHRNYTQSLWLGYNNTIIKFKNFKNKNKYLVLVLITYFLDRSNSYRFVPVLSIRIVIIEK